MPRVSGLLISCLALTAAGRSFAQMGVSSAGAARTKYLANAGLFPSPRDVVVEDFVNYHRHEIAQPKAGEAVALDVRWGSERASERNAVLQIGLATSLVHDRQNLRPLNLSLVIDKSGSMAAAGKLSRVKTSLLNLVSKLRPTDVLSIVLFDSKVEVLLPAQRVADRSTAMNLIRGIEPGSATNIDAGLMAGYREAEKFYSKESTNRVILLTDGIANQGVTDPKSIAHESQVENARGIDLSTIGVGLDLNRDLLQDLAKSGRGLFHFVADSEDIEKVFVDELQSLLSPVATEPNLEIDFGQGLELDKVYGYEPKRSKSTVRVKLDNLNNGATEVVLLRFKLPAGAENREELPIKVRLRYFDLDRNRKVETIQTTSLATKPGQAESAEDESVAKNYTIAQLAQSIRDMAIACEAKRYREAEGFLTSSIGTATRRYPNLEDADVKRTLAAATTYRDLLREKIKEEIVEEPIARTTDSIVPNGDFSLGNTGFTTERPYIQPGTNCLWGGYYTVTGQFNAPYQLHTNVVSNAFAAPGGGQMLYMNSGGSDSFTVWSTKVRCRPRTNYRVSFREIGLTPGPEWRNSYEIRVNGERSEPQLGGDGRFVTIDRTWASGSADNATVSIVRLPNAHGGGIIGIANVEMVAVKGR